MNKLTRLLSALMLAAGISSGTVLLAAPPGDVDANASSVACQVLLDIGDVVPVPGFLLKLFCDGD